MAQSPASPAAPALPPPLHLTLGRGVCWGLFVFDLGLGTVATFWPELYAQILHPFRHEPQIELIRRTGVLWYGFAAVALVAARSTAYQRPWWFLVLAVLRLMEVPADLVYGLTATGASGLARALILAAPPTNLALGGYLSWLAWRELRVRRVERDAARAAPG